jgi:hypothetical protein
MTTRTQIDAFLGLHRLAVVGVSHEPQDFTRQLFRELRQRGYDVVPVNPKAIKVEGSRCFARVQEITPPVEGALLMTSPDITEQVVRDCHEAGIKHVWMHRGVGDGAVSQAAIAYCNEHGIAVVAGFCLYMFLPDTSFVHCTHGFILKLTGAYPA